MSEQMRHKYQSYAAATQTVAPTQQIVMLYDGIISFVQQAKEAILEKRIEDRYKVLTKAREVLLGLQSCLDFENGGQIARTLYSFYSSIDNRIFSIHRTNSTETCDEVIAEMKKMRHVWHEIDQNTSANSPATTTPPSEAATTTGTDNNITLSA